MSNTSLPPLHPRLSRAGLQDASAAPPHQADQKKDELRLLVNSRHPLITIETAEEGRVEDLLQDVAAELGVPLFVWSVTTGMGRKDASPIYGSDAPEQALANIALIKGDALFLLKDFARYCENDRVCRRLRELAESFREARRSVVISAASLKLPPDLDDEAISFRLSMPDAADMLAVVKDVLSHASVEGRVSMDLDLTGMKQLAKNLVGLTRDEAARTLRMALLARGKADAQLLEDVLETKRKALRQEGLLEYVRQQSSFSDVAGLGRLKEWLRKRRGALTAEGRQFGLEPPKGILITGVQGCGKSLAAKAVAGEWGFDLARLDAGALYDKYIGELEKHLRKALDLAQQLAPIVLWIDEIEKGFAATSAGSDVDAGLSQRILATFLTWLQDRESGVFIAATSNNISALPPELLRKGRFDEIFFVDLPNDEARAALFALHLKKRGRDAGAFDLQKLAASSEGFSGAEIEQAIVSGLYTAFSQKQQLATEIILGELRSTQPLSVTRAEDIAALRAWARDRAVPAD